LTVTFTKPGVYRYHCALHDYMGMVGVVIVMPAGSE
jgi:plastocyanin